MTANEARIKARDKYKTLLGRNKYSQAKRTYVNTKYKDGCYYSDCSSSVAWALKQAGYPITYGGSSLPNTVGFYNSKDVVEVPVKINSKGEITNPEVLCIADSLLFAGTDTSRSGSGYVGHVEMVGEITSSGKVYIYGHGSGTPRRTEMQAYLRKRRAQSSPTKLGHRGLIKVVRRIQDDGNGSNNSSGSTGYKLGDRELKKGMTGADVKELQNGLISLGYDCGPDGADGDYGSNTALAVKAFQTVRVELKATGEADAATIAALIKALNLDPDAVPVSGARVVVSNCSECNIRSGPGKSYKSVGRAAPGDTFTAADGNLPDGDGWVPVVCWISPKYARKEGT